VSADIFFRGTDQCGRSVVLTRPPQRIVSLVPSQTELLADLGLDERVVGITKFCVHPREWRKTKAIAGGTKLTDPARILALKPELVIANKEENEASLIQALEKELPVYVSDVRDIPTALDMIRQVGRLTDRSEAANLSADDISARLAAIVPPPAPLRMVYLIWNQPMMTIGSDTFIHHMAAHFGFQNAFGGLSRYPEITDRDILSARPDVLFLSSEPFPFKESHAAEFRLRFPGIPVMVVDGEMFSWYGSRMKEAVGYLGELSEKLTS
jgi:ABC-type Fe3+-hydroxamate transport system substrate-binding protein